jgi:eukaryotic-like serine/threonine-protein kinase
MKDVEIGLTSLRPRHWVIIGAVPLLALLLWGAASFISALPTPTTTAAAPSAINSDLRATATPTLNPFIPPPRPTAGATWMRPADGMVMVYVPPGTFTMGSSSDDIDADSDEFPAHEVTLTEGFWIDRTEVTNEQYGRCVGDNDSCALPAYADNGDYNAPNQPVVGVSWEDAKDYCTWAGGQLPTEAQWEYAARGTAGHLYPWGNAFDGSKLNFCDTNCSYGWKDSNSDDGYALTAPVGSYPAGASWVGALDMAGNVWEWVNDWSDAGYYENSPAEDPAGPPDDGNYEYKVLRGGSWGYFASSVRAADRFLDRPAARDVYVGIRCVRGPG